MNRRACSRFIICILWLTASGAFAGDPAGTARNRISASAPPRFAVSLYTTVGIAQGETEHEMWRGVLTPSLSLELALFKFLSIGLSIPCEISVGFPGSLISGRISSPKLELAFITGGGAFTFRAGIHYIPAVDAVPAAGGSVSAAAIRDPVALKFTAYLDAAPRRGDRWRLDCGGCAAGLLVVLNEMISLEFGISLDIGAYNPVVAPPPSIVGRIGTNIQKAGFTVSVFARKALWDPGRPGSVSAGLAFAWGTQ